jgi:hypothetical protein
MNADRFIGALLVTFMSACAPAVAPATNHPQQTVRDPSPAQAATSSVCGATPSTPRLLDKSAVVAAISRRKYAAGSCYDKYREPGLVPVTISIGPTGDVIDAQVKEGPLVGTAEAQCIAEALRSAKFPSFEGPTQTICYPIMLR